jgi:hypothetical protein
MPYDVNLVATVGCECRERDNKRRRSVGTSRTRVTAIANGNTQGVSTDVLNRVLAATGHRAELRVKKSAASRLEPNPFRLNCLS